MIFTRRDGSTFELPEADARIVHYEMQENYLAEEITDDYCFLIDEGEAPDVPDIELQPSEVRKTCKDIFGTIFNYMFDFDRFSETWNEVIWYAAREFASCMRSKYPPKPPKIPLPHRNARI